MTSFTTEFLGCKVSMTDAQLVRERLLADGHSEGAAGDAAVHVLNTCCVTAEAVAKSRKAARRAARASRRVIVTGCAAALDGAFDGLPANVTVLSRRSEVLATAVSDEVGALSCTGVAEPAFGRMRAYLKIQDGCSFGCSYCVIPQVRGASRSREASAVLAEGRRRAAQGHRELVLTGVDLGCFRDRAAGLDLAGLLRAVAALDGIERVRLSSIEVNHLNDRLLTAMDETAGIARHLHVPMQAGSDTVLRAMRRHYSAATFLARMRRARERLPGVNLTSDVIVGHPAERAQDFAATLQAVRAAGFAKVHVFPYSPRPGTADAQDDPVPAAEKRRRSRELRRLSDEQGAAHRAAKVGSRELVLVEDAAGRGYSDDYTPYRVRGGEPGLIVPVRGVDADRDAVIATLCA